MKIRTKLGIAYSVQVLLTAALGIAALWSIAGVNREFSHDVQLSAPIMANARQLSKLVVDMETGQRGFCITQNEEFLEPYTNGAREFDELIKIEMQLVSDKPSQVALLKRINELVQEWQEKAAKPEIAMARKVATHDFDAEHFQLVLARGVGKRLMDSFMVLAHEIEVSFSERGDWEGEFAVEIIEKCMTDREAGQRGFLITGKEEYLEKYAAGEQHNLPAYFARLRTIVSKRGRSDQMSQKIDRLEQLARMWKDQAAEPEIAARRVMNKHPESLKDIAGLLEMKTGKQLVDEIRQHFDKFIAAEAADATLHYNKASATTAAINNITIAVVVFAICLGVILAVATSRAVTHPLAKLGRGVEMIGQGQLNTHIKDESSGEIGKLIHAFNSMAAELSENQKILEQLATTDKLTGLPNRAVFLDRVEQALKQSRRDRGRFAVLFFDFDRFKVVNDSLGHGVGDALLCDIADIFRENLRAVDAVARFGGDEFVVLLENLPDWSDAEPRARELLVAFAKPHELGDHVVISTASIGLVTNEFAYENPSEIIRDADAALHQAKDSGRAQVVVFDRAMHAKALDRLNLESDMLSALSNDEFQLVYQPIVELDSGGLAGFEALIRWNHPERGVISPLDFIPIAEETGLIIDIGNWTLKTATAQISDWNRRLGGERMLKVNVNVSRRQLLNPTFLDFVRECRRDCGLDVGELQLEVTESAIADTRTDMVPLLEKLRENGIPIVMDDFGTGVSSLGMLHGFPIDVLKIDQAFIRMVDGDRSLLAVVAAITNLAENIGIRTVAEGIETDDAIGALQSIGCTWGQGYHFARPLSAADAEAYILDNQQEHGEPRAA